MNAKKYVDLVVENIGQAMDVDKRFNLFQTTLESSKALTHASQFATAVTSQLVNLTLGSQSVFGSKSFGLIPSELKNTAQVVLAPFDFISFGLYLFALYLIIGSILLVLGYGYIAQRDDTKRKVNKRGVYQISQIPTAQTLVKDDIPIDDLLLPILPF